MFKAHSVKKINGAAHKNCEYMSTKAEKGSSDTFDYMGLSKSIQHTWSSFLPLKLI